MGFSSGWMRAVILLAMILLVPLRARAADETHAKTRVVIILADDLGYEDAGMQGIASDVKTPNIDSIAHNGVRFTSAYVSCPVCSPSRAGLLTGRYQERFGHEANPAANYDAIFGLPVDQVTLADEMKKAGYVTGAFGKWHLGGAEQFRPQKRGFDEFFGFLGGAHAYFKPGTGLNALRRGDEPVEEKAYLTDAIAREAVAFIHHHKSEPFFLYVPFNAVHTPQAAPPKYQQRFADVKDEKRKMLLAMLSALDDGVGNILSALRDEKLEENTLVIFLSDNGGPTDGNGSKNHPLRGYKGQVWEGGIRIPMAIQWKGQIKPGQVIDDPVISLDLFPTTLAATGAAPDANLKLDGVNLLPLLRGETKDPPHQTLYWRFTPAWAIRDGNFKLLLTREGSKGLFDLSKDISEKNNLLDSMPETASQLQKKFDAWNAQLHAPLWPGRQEGSQVDEKAAREDDFD